MLIHLVLQGAPRPRRPAAHAGRSLWLCALVLGLLLLMAGEGRAETHAPPDLRRITQRGELVVALPSFDAPPFFYQQHGTLRGVDIELIQGLAEALKVKLRFNRRASTFNGVLDLVASGEVDLAMGKLSRTLTRATRVRFSDPYLTFNHALVINRLRFADLVHGQDLATVVRHFTGSIGVIDQSSFAEFAPHNFPAAKLVKYRDWEAVLTALRKGEVTAAYRDELEIDRLLRQDPRATLVLRTVTFTDLEDTLGLAVAPDSQQLLALINLYLSQRVDKLTVEKVEQRFEVTQP